MFDPSPLAGGEHYEPLALDAPLWASPFVPSAPRLTRRACWRLREELRPFWPHRVNAKGATVEAEASRCGFTRCSRDVELSVRAGPDGSRSAFVRGVVTCGSVWDCAVCSSKIRSARAHEVRAALEWHGGERVFLLSLTVRHGREHDPKQLQQGVSRAWSAFTSGAPWRRFAAHVGLVGVIRGLETTHGHVNGWHPHIHALLLVKHPERLAEKAQWLRDRWHDVVVRRPELGQACEPSDANGCNVKQAACADYLVKLGLEVTAPSTKTGKKGRTPWEIATAYVLDRKPADLALFLAFAAAFKGARQLVWSDGLKAAAGIEERADAALAAEAATTTESQVAVLPGSTWCALRRVRGAIEALLCLAESEPQHVPAFLAWIERVAPERRPSSAPPNA